MDGLPDWTNPLWWAQVPLHAAHHPRPAFRVLMIAVVVALALSLLSEAGRWVNRKLTGRTS